MHDILDKVFSCTRACERLLASELTLTKDERNILEYYIREVAQQYDFKFLSVELPQRANSMATSAAEQ